MFTHIKIKKIIAVFSHFSFIGIIGIFINQGTLYLLVHYFSVAIEIAGIVAIELSIINNFLLNNYFTWKKKTNGIFKRCIKYHTVTIFSSGINYVILLIGTQAGLHYLIANIGGVLLSMMINFVLHYKWTFRSRN